MGKIYRGIVNVFLIIVIVLLVGYFALRLLDVVRIYSVETGSMEDKIHTGDYILLFKKSHYSLGDVITYQVDGYFVTHRIVKIEGDEITTKGDANNVEDKAIDISQVEGKAIYWGGLLNYIIKYKYVFVVLLLGLYLLSCYLEENREKKIKENK